jgi:hypothetical protein
LFKYAADFLRGDESRVLKLIAGARKQPLDYNLLAEEAAAVALVAKWQND